MLKETLRRPGKDLVFAMIQKYRGELLEDDEPDLGLDADWNDGDEVELPMMAEARLHYLAEAGAPRAVAPFPELNADEDILVLVGEAHRNQTNTAHANLLRALPNCAKIGFTGTPIIMRAKGETTRIFGDFIDRHTIRQAEADGATVPILYEGRTTGAAVDDGRGLDAVFEDMLVNRTPEELEAIKRKYATKGHVMEADRLIAAKARNMPRH